MILYNVKVFSTGSQKKPYLLMLIFANFSTCYLFHGAGGWGRQEEEGHRTGFLLAVTLAYASSKTTFGTLHKNRQARPRCIQRALGVLLTFKKMY